MTTKSVAGRSQGPTARTAVDGGVLDVHLDGRPDATPVLLLHGFPQRADCWAAVSRALVAAGHRTIAPDQRGYSPSARPAGHAAYTLDALVADAVAVIDDAVGPGGRVHVVGHDWGASIGWRLAARHPDRVRSLTAVSVPPPGAMVRAVLTTRQVFASWYLAALQLPWVPERVLGARGRAFSPTFVEILCRSGQSRARAERDAARLAEPAALTAALDWYRALRLARSGDADPPVTVPSQLVWGESDTALTRQSVELAGRHVGGPYRYVELRGVGHWIPEEAPDLLAELVGEHIARYPG